MEDDGSMRRGSVVVLLLGLSLLGCGRSKPAVETGSASYWERVSALLAPEDEKRLSPSAGGADLAAVDPAARSAAGARLGQTMEDVIRIWGPPHKLGTMRRYDRGARAFYRQITIGYGFGLDFSFRDGVLEEIKVQGLEGAYLVGGGPSLGATQADARRLLGAPAELGNADRTWVYDLPNAKLSLWFHAGRRDPEPVLKAIRISGRGVEGDSAVTEL
jgi:hypothetical protein